MVTLQSSSKASDFLKKYFRNKNINIGGGEMEEKNIHKQDYLKKVGFFFLNIHSKA